MDIYDHQKCHYKRKTITVIFLISICFLLSCEKGENICASAYSNKNIEETITRCGDAAHNGGYLEQYYLAWAHFEKNTKRDDKLAYNWARESSKQGFTPAVELLGRMYEKGRYVQQDYKTAEEFYQIAAKPGNYGEAFISLGLLHFRGLGREKNEIIGVEFFEKAALLGKPDHIYMAILAHNEMNNLAGAYAWSMVMKKSCPKFYARMKIKIDDNDLDRMSEEDREAGRQIFNELDIKIDKQGKNKPQSKDCTDKH